MQKKYITVAALLVAGMALSDAAVAWDSDTSSYSFTADSWSKGTTYYELSLAGAGFDLSQENWKISLTLTALPSTATNQWGTAAFATGSNPLEDSYTQGFQAYLKVGGEIVVKGNSFDATYSSGTTLATLTTKDSAADYTFTLVREGSKTTYSVLDSAGTVLGSSEKTITNWSGKVTMLTTSITDSQLEAGWTLASGTMTVVPEPSAFGLLSGIGALALVAARRRRSRK